MYELFETQQCFKTEPNADFMHRRHDKPELLQNSRLVL